MHMVRRGRDSARSAWHGSIHAVEALRVQSGVLGPGLGMDGFLQNMKIIIIIRYDHWAESVNQGCRLRLMASSGSSSECNRSFYKLACALFCRYTAS
jgi:hypothetical protein